MEALGSLRAELRMMCSLIVFASTDTRRPCCPVVTATDASTGEDGSDFGGFGVVQREASVSQVSRACRTSAVRMVSGPHARVPFDLRRRTA